MKDATLCFIFRDRPPQEVLLGLKKRGFGTGKLNGFGGKIQRGESLIEAATREVQEETTLILPASTLRPAGTVTFVFPFEPSFDHHVHLFTATQWIGRPRETAEMAPGWFPIDRIPYARMWADDPHWLPRVLAGRKIKATFTFAEDNESLTAWKIHEMDPD